MLVYVQAKSSTDVCFDVSVERVDKKMQKYATVNFAYNDTLRGIKKVSLFAKCRYTRSLIICITVGWEFALGMEILSLFTNCRYTRSRY